MQKKSRQPVNQFLALSIIEGLIVAVVLLLIPADPKNAFLFGYSKSRLVLLVFTLALTTILCLALFHKTMRETVNRTMKSSGFVAKSAPWIGGLAALLLWLSIWMPPYRLDTLAAGFTRVQPVLIWVELVVLQFSMAVWLLHRTPGPSDSAVKSPRVKRLVLLGAGLFTLVILVYIGLSFFSPQFSGSQLYFPPGAPLTGLQVLAAWVAAFLVFLLEKRDL